MRSKGYPDDVRFRDWGFFIAGFLLAIVGFWSVYVAPEPPVAVIGSASNGFYVPCMESDISICLNRYLDIGQ